MEAEPGGDHHAQSLGVGRRPAGLLRPADPAQQRSVEVDEREQPDSDTGGEEPGQQREARGVALEGGFHGLAGVGEDVPEQEDQDPGRQRVQEALDRTRQPAYPGHRETNENGEACDRAEAGGGEVAHAEFSILVRTKHGIR